MVSRHIPQSYGELRYQPTLSPYTCHPTLSPYELRYHPTLSSQAYHPTLSSAIFLHSAIRLGYLPTPCPVLTARTAFVPASVLGLGQIALSAGLAASPAITLNCVQIYPEADAIRHSLPWLCAIAGYTRATRYPCGCGDGCVPRWPGDPPFRAAVLLFMAAVLLYGCSAAVYGCSAAAVCGCRAVAVGMVAFPVGH
eukprot:3940659-Rhodomonas_salina.1